MVYRFTINVAPVTHTALDLFYLNRAMQELKRNVRFGPPIEDGEIKVDGVTNYSRPEYIGVYTPSGTGITLEGAWEKFREKYGIPESSIPLMEMR